MDLILHNGIIHTMKGLEIVSAVAIKNGLVAQTGSDEEILALKTAHTQVVDLQKKLALPGFNDSHLHILSYGLNKRRLNVHGVKSVEEIIDKGREYICQKPGLKLLLGRGWNQDYFINHALPSKKDLDNISRDIPIIIYRICGHSAVVNSKALEVFGVAKNARPPLGGSFDWQSGLFCEAALDFFPPPAQSVEQIKEALLDATTEMLSKGLTSAQSDDFGFAAYPDVIQAYSELAGQGKLPLRVYQQCLAANIADVKKFCGEGDVFPANNHFYQRGPVKILTDGSLGARTALLSRPYADDASTTGIACFSQAELDEMVCFCQETGRDAAIHCIGDGALSMALSSVDKAQKAFGRGPRHGIVHCQISDTPLLQKIAELGMMAYIQPIFLDYDIHIVKERVGEELAETSYNFKTLCDLGVNVSLGTDCPVEPFDPLPNIYCAVTRKDLRGFPKGGFGVGQALTVHQAVYCYTAGSAYCSHQENIKGKLQAGYLADMAVIDRDIFTIEPAQIKDAKVKMTIVGGKIVYAVK